MADYGTNYTDKELNKLEKKIKSVYKEAEKDIQKKMDNFTARSKAKEQKYLQKVTKGEMTQAEFDKWKAGQVFQGKQWAAKKEEIANVLYNANTTASKIVNNEQFNVFTANANFASYQMEQGAGVNFGFSLYDQNTVIRLIKDEPNLLPNYVPKKSKDMTWNTKKITRQITQGIIQGESLDKISKRLATVTASQNFNSMKTHARTLMTGAQNAGRLNSYENAQKLGIEMEKEWMATLDGHTRDSHADIDGEKQPVDHKFSNDCMYPGDPGGPPAEVYNCRCTMVSDIKKYPSIYNRYDNQTRSRIQNMSYNDWKDAKKAGKSMAPYSIDKIKIGNLFEGLSQNGAYTMIHDVDVKLSNQFYKELQEMGKNYDTLAKPSAVWNDYLNGNLPDGVSSAKLENIMGQYKDKAMVTKVAPAPNPVTTIVTEAEQKEAFAILNKYQSADELFLTGQSKDLDIIMEYSKKTGQDLPALMKEAKDQEVKALETAKKNLKNIEDAIKKQGADKEFTGIWKDPVTYKDYEAKAGSIQAKKDYYNDQIEKYAHEIKLGNGVLWHEDQIAKLKENLKQLEEFEKNGAKYSRLYKDLEKAQKEVKALTPGSPAFSDERKKAALWAKTDKEYKDLDKYYDKVAKKVHDAKTSAEHEGYYHYTWGSGPFNQPLAGFDGGWSQSAFKGVGKVNINDNGYGNKIRGLTSLIEKSTYDKDVWLQSGQTTDTLAGFLGIPRGSFNNMTDTELQQFVGIEKEIPQFISGAINKGGGSYTPGDMLFNIYCPSGSEMLYVRSDGYFKKSEHEMILQRGGTYKIDKIYWGKDTTTGRKKLIVDLELHNERGYNKFQQ